MFKNGGRVSAFAKKADQARGFLLHLAVAFSGA
jgi:hypothetical protein